MAKSMKNPIFLSLTLAALAALSYRIFFGLDLGDESFHLATAHHFALGAKAFQDETSIRQIFAFFTLPLIKGLRFLNPSNESLVLYMRFAFLFCHLGFCLLVRKTVKRFAPKSAIFVDLAILVTLFFIPVNVFSLHYATLGFMFLGASLCITFFSEKSGSSPLIFFSWVTLAFATASHPGIFISALFMLLSSRNKRWLNALGFLSSWLLLMILFNFTPSDYLRSIVQTKDTIQQSGTELGLAKFFGMIAELSPKGPFPVILLLWVISFVLLTKSKSRIWILVNLFLFPIITFFNSRTSQGGLGSAGYMLCLSYFSPLLCWYFAGLDKAKKYSLQFWIPCFLAFIGCSFLSSGGVAGTSGALITTLPFSLVFLSEALKKAMGTHSDLKREIICSIPIFLFLVFFVRGTFSSVYQENTNQYSLSSQITSGPFKGLKTSETKKLFIETLEKDLKSLPIKQGRIVFTCFLPAGYLLTNLFPNHDFLWGTPSLTQIKPNTDIVVRVFDQTYTKINVWPQHCEALSETVAGNKGTIIKKQDYEIWVKNESIGSNLEKQL